MTEPTRDASIEFPPQEPAHPAAADAMPTAASSAMTTAAGDSADSDSPYLGSTLNSQAASAAVNNITGEVSLTVPLVDLPTVQGLGPRLTINLVYNSSSTTGSALVSPYLGTFAVVAFTASASAEYPILFASDWDLDLPAIVQNGTSWSLRFQGQSWQANLNTSDTSSSKTAFYYAKGLEHGNKLKLSYVNGTDIRGGATVTTPDGIQYAITHPGAHGWLLNAISSPNGKRLTFSYVLPSWPGGILDPHTDGSLSVQDQDGNLVYRLVACSSFAPNGSGALLNTNILYGSFTNPGQAGSAVYDTFATLNATGGVSQSGLGLYPNNPTAYQYATVAVGGSSLTKLSRITDPTGASTQFNWLTGGFVVKYGVVHVTGSGSSDISHTFSYSFAPVDTQSLHDADGNQVWSKQFYYSQDQSEGATKNSDNGSATFQCPNMWEFDTNELAHGVAPANNWFDPLFNSTEHRHDNGEPVGDTYTTGNVSPKIRTQTFSVYEITQFSDQSQMMVVQTFDCLQRLATMQCSQRLPGAPSWALVSEKDYTYEIAVGQIGVVYPPNFPPIGPMYASYASLPANFDQPIAVTTKTGALFNGRVWATGTPPPWTLVKYAYDQYGNQISGTSACGVSQSFQYASGLALPCGINPYVTTATTIPTPAVTMGAVTLAPAQYLDGQGALHPITGNTNSTVYTTADGCIRPLTMTTTASGAAGPLTRTYGYDASGRVSTITESGTGFATTLTTTYTTDANGNQVIATSTSYGAGGSGPALPSAQTIDRLGRTISQTDAQGRVTQSEYDSLGRLTQQIALANLPAAQQLVTRYCYGLGQGGSSVTVTSPIGTQIHYTFDSLGRQTSNAIQGVGETTPRTVRSFTYASVPANTPGGPNAGQLASATTTIAPGAATATTYYYNALGDQVAAIPVVGLGQVSLPFNTGPYGYVLSFNCTWSPSGGLTLYGRATLVQSCAITGVTIASYVFDSALLDVSPGSGANANLDGVLSNPAIVASLIAADGSVATGNLTPAYYAVTTSHRYDSLYRLVGDTLSGNGATWSIGRCYDINGRLARMTDPSGSQYAMTYNAQGCATELVLTPAQAGTGYSLARAVCNAAGQRTSYSNLAGVAGAPVTPPSTTYTYDATSGVITGQTDGLKNSVYYLWYPTGALAAIYSPMDTGWYLWSALTYDQYGAILRQQCGPIASQPSLTNLTPSSPDARYSYVYDANGRMTAKTVQYAGQSPQTTSYSYDAYGNNAGFANPWGQSLSVTLDQYGRKSLLSGTEQTLSYSYDSLGRPASVVRTYNPTYLGCPVQSTLTYSYDALMRTTGLCEATAGIGWTGGCNAQTGLVTGFTQTLSYDFWDHIIGNAIQIQSHGQPADDLTISYGYDTWERLESYTVAPGATLAVLGVDGAAIAARAFQYDLQDNITRTVDTPQTGDPFTAVYGYLPQSPFLLDNVSPRPGQAAWSSAYDALHRTTTDTHGTQIAYDALGRVAAMTLVSGEIIRYTYGPGGEAIKQTASDGAALYTYYEGASPVARVDAGGAVQPRTLFGFGTPATLTTDDLLGNPVLTRSLAVQPGRWAPPGPKEPGTLGNTLIAKNVFDPTGVATNWAGANPQAGYPQNLKPAAGSPLTAANLPNGGLGYNDAITDPLTGYQLLGSYRAYDPAVGRFQVPDSAFPGSGSNPYAYTGNQFVGASDPSGHYTYTYKSYHKAIKAIERAAARRSGHGFWGQLVSNYEHVITNMIKHPGNVNTWVAAATTYANPMGPLMAAASDQLRKAGPAGEVFSGVYDGIQSFAMGTASLGFASYNPQTGTGAFQSAGVGNMLGVMTLGYVNMAPNGMPEVHAGHSFGTHLERWAKGVGDLPENMVSDMLAVPIGLCYDMPMDFASGNYYMAGFAFGYNTAALVAMVAAPEDAGVADDAGALTADADLTGVSDLFKEDDDEYYFGNREEPGFFRSFGTGFTDEIKERPASGVKTASGIDRGMHGKFGSKAVREARAGRFRAYCGEYLGREIAKGLVNPMTYENLNMTDPRSPWSTAAWQTMLYRQGPAKPKEK